MNSQCQLAEQAVDSETNDEVIALVQANVSVD
jgi:hypothetical protein